MYDRYRNVMRAGALIALAVLLLAGCQNNSGTNSAYSAVNLVGDSAFAGARIDTTLLNAWGIAYDPSGNIAVAANHLPGCEFYTWSGSSAMAAITIPGPDDTTPGAPSGAVYNSTSNFDVPGSTMTVAKFIFVGEDGVVSAWASGTSATRVLVAADPNTVYKGLAMASDGGDNFLYAANFREKRIDVYDGDFTLVTGRSFTDPSVPADYGPFNIVNINETLYVAYAMPKAPDFMDDSAGDGHGYLAIFKPDGTLIKHLYSQGVLNSPWGIARGTAGFGAYKDAILVGNFGDGKIHAFDESGTLLGTLKGSDSTDVTIDGLWGLSNGVPGYGDYLYFTAGPDHENHGLFGYVKKD